MSGKFEKNLAKLEEIVTQLEEGQGGLEESLKAFEVGVKLSKECHQELSEAQKKVEILIQDANGNEEPHSFQA